jgi:ribosomal-protein-alanine N-acetyltransferase
VTLLGGLRRALGRATVPLYLALRVQAGPDTQKRLAPRRRSGENLAMHERDITLGFAYRADASALAAMSRDLVEAGLGWAYQAHRIRELIGDPEVVTLVARDHGRAVGFAIMKFTDDRAHLVLLAVARSHQRRGIGRRLLEWLLESARVAGTVSLHVELRAENRPAYLLYRSLQFTETFRINGYYRGREPALRMVRVLRVPAAQLRT